MFLRVRSKRINRIHHERRLDGNETPQRRITALDFLRHETVLHVRQACAAVAIQIGAEKTKLRHLRNEMRGKFSFAIVVLDDGENLIVHKLTRRLAGQLFFIAQQRIEIEVIHSGETGHVHLLGCRRP